MLDIYTQIWVDNYDSIWDVYNVHLILTKHYEKTTLYFSILKSIFLGLLYGDLITNSNAISEELEKFYIVKNQYGTTSTGGSRYEIHNYLSCKSGKKYKIGIVPQVNIQKGEIVKITETKFLNKVKLFEFKENGNIKKVNLSFLLDSYILVFSILTLLVTICYVYKNHPLTEFALSVFSVLNFALTFIYLNYF